MRFSFLSVFGAWFACNIAIFYAFLRVYRMLRSYATHLQLSDGFKQWFGTNFGCCDTVIGSRYVSFHIEREEFTRKNHIHVYGLVSSFWFSFHLPSPKNKVMQLKLCAFDSVMISHYFCTFNKVTCIHTYTWIIAAQLVCMLRIKKYFR